MTRLVKGYNMATICALKQASIYFFEKITGIRGQVPAIFIENNKVVLGDFN
jgi:hypothetical protein